MISLAVKYRPTTFNEVVGQGSMRTILQQQLSSGDIRNAYLFTGPAGCGKTTCARIFANEVNKGEGNPIELDAASNNSVDDVRDIIQQARLKSLTSEYKVFIVDECHSLSNQAWQAMLKLLEEPPAKSIFIFCTTDPQKIPKTIISRVQRYDFQRISQFGIVCRLQFIVCSEGLSANEWEQDALEYIAKLADGGMRDAITMLDKCLSYSPNLTLENVVETVGVIPHKLMINLTDAILDTNNKEVAELIEEFYDKGGDIKQFVKSYIQFLIDLKKYEAGCDWRFISIPKLNETEKWLRKLTWEDFKVIDEVLTTMIRLNADIKYSSTPRYDLEAVILAR